MKFSIYFFRFLKSFSYQRVRVVARQYEHVDGRGVVGHADAVLGLVLLVVVGDDGRESAAKDLEAARVDLVVELLLALALWKTANERHADSHPNQLG